MPTKPLSHAERQRPARSRQSRRLYNATTRKRRPDLAAAQKIRSSQRWQRLAVLQLTAEPLCQNPYGQHADPVPAVHADHIIPLRVDRTLAFSRENLQSLCIACHARKTAWEKQFYG